MQDKKKTKHIKVRDLKPKKDAKGGVVMNQTQNHGIQSLQNHKIQGNQK
jgi:hypothetical protein